MATKDTETQLMLSQAQVSRVVAACIVLLVFVFIAGYYLGKKNQSKELTEHIQQNAFADQIHSSFYTMYPDTLSPDAAYPEQEQQEGQKR